MRSVIKPPAIDKAVHTTPPITRAAIMPDSPSKPTETRTSDERIRVIKVIPDTGLEPTIAMALAATVVKRNAMTNTMAKATIVCIQLPSTPNWKNTSVAASDAMISERMSFIEMSRCVRGSTPCDFLPENSFLASTKALLMIPAWRTMPIRPAMAIPPMPIGRPIYW